MKLARTRKMKVAKKNSKKASKKSTRKLKGTKKYSARGGAPKRPRDEVYYENENGNENGNENVLENENQQPAKKQKVDYTPMFGDMLATIGNTNILDDFARFLGRPDPDIVMCYQSDSPGECVGKEGKALRNKEFSGLIFKSGHWRGFEPMNADGNRTIYDSYPTGLQSSGTNNFCQSYATFLWARRGSFEYKNDEYNIDIKFIPAEYPENIQKMAKLWIGWVDYIYTRQGGKKWVNGIIKNGMKKDGDIGDDLDFIAQGYNIDKFRLTLEKIASDYDIADELSSSDLQG